MLTSNAFEVLGYTVPPPGSSVAVDMLVCRVKLRRTSTAMGDSRFSRERQAAEMAPFYSRD